MIDMEPVRMSLASVLPGLARWTLADTEIAFDFGRLRHPLLALRPAEFSFEMDEAWSNLHVFGLMEVADGGGSSTRLAIDARTGEVVGLDIEAAPPVRFFNSDAHAFVSMFKLFSDALQSGAHLEPPLGRASSVDPEGYFRSEWRLLAEHILEGP